MKIVIPKKASTPVEHFDDIKRIASDMQSALENEEFERGPWKKGSIALHHSQVDLDDPKNFFVIKRAIVRAKSNEVVVVVNPKITDKDKDSKILSKEGCISFPFRPDKHIHRYNRIEVEYDTPNEKGELVKRKEWMQGFMAHIFQHEIQHAQGGHIYKV